MSVFDEDQLVTPDGTAIRRLRRAGGRSKRDFVRHMGEVHERETGLYETISVNELEGIEEANERVPYAVVCRVAAGLDADPVQLLNDG